MPVQRLRPLLQSTLPGTIGVMSAAVALAGAATTPWPWRAAAATAAALAGAASTSCIREALARRRWANRNGLTDVEETCPQRRRPRSTPTDAERDVIAELLRDVRDALGATDVLFWRIAPGGEGLVAAAAASDAPDFGAVGSGATLEVISWSAQERIPQYSAEPEGVLGAAPVLARGVLLGALSVHAPSPLAGTHDEIRTRLLRHALHIGDVVDLVDTRIEHELQSRHSQLLLTAASEFQLLRSPKELAAAVCKAAIGVTGAERAALVRWNADDRVGRVEHVSATAEHSAPRIVTADSIVGAVCQDGLPQLWDDARLLEPGTPLFGSGERARTIQSLGVVPIAGCAGVIGAIVLEGDAPGRLRSPDMRTVRLLTALASVSIEMLDDIEAADRRAHTDQLTGLPNRRAFEAQFGPALERADRFAEPVAVILCDVDSFKAVNDTHGHQVGDLVLRSIAGLVQRGVRAVDSCARFGGEEFIVLLPRTSRAGAMELAERLRRAIEARPVSANGRELRVTASFGVAIYPATVTSRDALVAAADRALYVAKRDGRNCVRCADAPAALD